MVYDEGSPAVIIDNATKSFNSHLVLDSFNMSIQQGSIYALIGPSGCGKTTVLRCIVGFCGMDSGSIRLNIKRKSQLGYMPQDCGLNDELSSEEIFYFHGRINFMTEQDIKSRIQQLVRLLDLPDVTQIVKSISGGQYRRVSLAVALLHDPKLLLLDEPTVGLDPVLRHDIWDHLKQLVTKQEKTILLTTHYIEEAKFADTVGFMMQGTLLEEGSPYHFIQTYRMNYLEEIFLYLANQHRNRITSELCSEYTKVRKPYFKQEIS
uniref:ABC transporter domain-containing protein n=1 Tax=Clastoptera arizonana TaxID=38151 RepID=A0A1B6EA01_9HEMI